MKRALLLAGVFLLFGTTFQAQAAPKPLKVSANPSLFPTFSPQIRNYVIRGCTTQKVRLKANLPERAKIRTTGRKWKKHVKGVTLSPGQALRFQTKRYKKEAKSYWVRCLPDDFPAYTYQKERSANSDYYFVTPGELTQVQGVYATIFDSNGVPVWFFKPPQSSPIDAKLLPSGRFAWARRDYSGYEIRNTRGELLRVAAVQGSMTDHHDMLELANGNLLLMSYKQRGGVDLSEFGGSNNATVEDALFQEINAENQVVWEWNSKDHIALAETGRWWEPPLNDPFVDGDPYDIVHVNSFEVVGDSIVASFRHTDAVYSINRTTGEIEWKLGGTPTPESLDILSDPHGDYPLGGQHDARVMPDGTVTIHDNATGLNRLPRIVRYSVQGDTATLVEEHTDPLVPSSFCCGGTRRDPQTGSWVTSWGSTQVVREIAADGSTNFLLQFEQPVTSYRVAPFAEGAVVSARSLRHGMNFIYR